MKSGDRVQARTDGQLGFLEQDDSGVLMVRLDRPAQSRQVVPYNDSDWLPARSERFTEMQIARCCYALDRELRTVRGEYSVPAFVEMKDQQRQKLMLGPPATADQLRGLLWEKVRELLGRA